MKRLRTVLSALVASVMMAAASAAPANSNESEAAGLSMSVVQSESGSGSSRVITWTVTITDTRGRTFISSGTPNQNEIRVARSSSRACVSRPVAFSANSLNSGDCQSVFSVLFSSNPSRFVSSPGSLTYTVTSQDVLSLDLAGYENLLATTRPYGAVVAYLGFHTDPAPNTTSLNWNLYASTGNWTPTPVAGIVTVAGVGGASPDNKKPDMDPGVPFAGPLLSKVERKIAGGSGTITLFGKRMFTVTSATIKGQAVEFTPTSRSGKFVTVSFKGLEVGSHDLVLHSDGFGDTTIRGAIVVR